MILKPKISLKKPQWVSLPKVAFAPLLARLRWPRWIKAPQWFLGCLLAALLLTATLLALSWPYRPKIADVHFDQEVRLLLELQQVLYKKTGGYPTMDSIRDVSFGNGAVGEKMHLALKRQVKERPAETEDNKDALRKMAEALDRWDAAIADFWLDLTLFYAPLVVFGLGPPGMVYVIGQKRFIAWQAARAERALHAAAGAKKRREMALARSLAKMKLRPQTGAQDGA